jgi:hypothetical protein
LFASRLQRDELVAKIDEGHRPALAAQLKVEDAVVKRQRFLDVANFHRYVVEANSARLCGANHSTLLSVDNFHKLDHSIVRSHGGSNRPSPCFDRCAAAQHHVHARRGAQESLLCSISGSKPH